MRMNVLYNMWMPIYRKGESQFGLTQRAMEEFQLRFGHAEKQEQILGEVTNEHMTGKGSAESMVRGFDAVQELREHNFRNVSVQESEHNETIEDHQNRVHELNSDGGIQMGNIKFQEELPVSGDDLTRGKVLREMRNREGK